MGTVDPLIYFEFDGHYRRANYIKMRRTIVPAN